MTNSETGPQKLLVQLASLRFVKLLGSSFF